MHRAGSSAAGKARADRGARAVELQTLFARALVKRCVPNLDERIARGELLHGFVPLAVEGFDVLGDADRREANVKCAWRARLARSVANKRAEVLSDARRAARIEKRAREACALRVGEEAMQRSQARGACVSANRNYVAVEITLKQPRKVVSVCWVDCARRELSPSP